MGYLDVDKINKEYFHLDVGQVLRKGSSESLACKNYLTVWSSNQPASHW